MGVVYAGTDATGRRAAVKVLKFGAANDEHMRSRFVREAQSLAKLDTGATARVLAADVDSDIPYIASEFIDGPTLWELVQEEGPLSLHDALMVGETLSAVLRTVHAVGVLHRDLKPSNVMMSDRGPVVIDFGIAHVADATALTSTTTSFGSVGWLAPEALEGDSASTAACDVFGWGATLAYAATGRPPFGTGRLERIVYRTLHDEADVEGVDPVLADVLHSSMRKNPADRPSLDTLQDRLRRVLAASAPSTTTRTSRRHRTRWPAAGAGRARPAIGAQLAHSTTPNEESGASTMHVTRSHPASARTGRRRTTTTLGAVGAVVVIAATAALWEPAVLNAPNTGRADAATTPTAVAMTPSVTPTRSEAVTTRTAAPSTLETRAPADAKPTQDPLDAISGADLPDCAAPCDVFHTLRRNFLGEAGAEQMLVFAGNDTRGVTAYLVSGSRPEVVASISDLGVMTRFPGSGYWIRYDTTGNVFINVVGASSTAVVALTFGAPDGMRIAGPSGTEEYFVNATVTDDTGDGDFIIEAQYNDCDPSCADGSIYDIAYHWTGESYTPIE